MMFWAGPGSSIAIIVRPNIEPIGPGSHEVMGLPGTLGSKELSYLVLMADSSHTYTGKAPYPYEDREGSDKPEVMVLPTVA